MKTIVRTVMLLLLVSCSAISAKKVSKTASITLKAEMQQSVLPANQKQNAIIKISVIAPEIVVNDERNVKVNLAVVLDKSGSMNSAGKMANARQAAIRALNTLSSNDIFSLVVYDTQARTLIPAQQVKDKTAIEALIRNIQPSGSTALFAGVSFGANEIRKFTKKGYINRIILLSDGLANVGPSAPKELGNLGTSLIKEGISVSTIGVGSDYNEDLMTALSQNSDGNFYFVENSNDLPMIFSKELGSALKVAAKSLTIRIEFPKGIKPLGVLGHNYKVIDNKMDIHFNQVYGGHEKALILQVEVPPEQADKKLELASIQMNYEDVDSGKPKSTSERVVASFSTDKNEIIRNINPQVVEDFANVYNATNVDKALINADNGNYKEAQRLINDGAAQLEQAAKQTGNVQLQQRAKEYYKQAEQLKKKKYKSQRKVLRGKSYQDKNYQRYKQ